MLYILRLYLIFMNCICICASLHISSILYCIFILCIIVTNLALWLQDLNKLTYLLTYYLASLGFVSVIIQSCSVCRCTSLATCQSTLVFMAHSRHVEFLFSY